MQLGSLFALVCSFLFGGVGIKVIGVRFLWMLQVCVSTMECKYEATLF